MRWAVFLLNRGLWWICAPPMYVAAIVIVLPIIARPRKWVYLTKLLWSDFWDVDSRLSKPTSTKDPK